MPAHVVHADHTKVIRLTIDEIKRRDMTLAEAGADEGQNSSV